MKPLLIETWGDLRGREVEKPEAILGPIINRGSIGMVHGPRGLGKSLWCQSASVCAAAGTPFLDFLVPKPVITVYADGEMLDWERQKRFKRIEGDNAIKGVRDRLYIIRPNFDAGVLPDLETAEGQRLLEELLPQGTALLIIDNLSAWCRSGREDAESWRKVQEWAMRMRAKGYAILFVHHSNKRGGQRGTSMREDVLDYVIALRPATNRAAKGTSFEMHFEKLRHVPRDKIKSVLLRYRTPKDKPARWEISPLAPDEKMAEVSALQEQGLTNVEIAKQLGVSRATIQRYVKDLKNRG